MGGAAGTGSERKTKPQLQQTLVSSAYGCSCGRNERVSGRVNQCSGVDCHNVEGVRDVCCLSEEF